MNQAETGTTEFGKCSSGFSVGGHADSVASRITKRRPRVTFYSVFKDAEYLSKNWIRIGATEEQELSRGSD
ncbi:hypothetical protein LRP30_32125 [Bradyrhizobium sp. C-145]|uniref:hypothetical protein n=1 Tax=Bradyrhizobium sp. C-145 TaxID=574727 RepID=UPI00201B56ED|nr:hypothetical protein [Bradyrhizobium sp. C-145]UQR61487.1 hypothetical protein LRP30_32125 [Bradyrhizobium sp. C-145]